MSKKWLALLVVFMLVTSVFAGCSQKQEEVKADAGNNFGIQIEDDEVVYPISIVDGLNNNVIIEKKPERVISLAPSMTEIIYAIGLGEKLVAVSDWCNYPVEVLAKEKVGSSWGTNTERIIELEPDLVFVYGPGQPEEIEQLTAAGITIAHFEPESINEIFEAIRVVGQIFGTEETANAVVFDMTERKNAILDKVKGQPIKRVFYQVWHEPLMTASTGSFIDELIRLAGGENIAADTEGAWPMYSVEALVEKDPEVYLAPAHMGQEGNLTKEIEEQVIEDIKGRPGYDGINAIVNNRIVVLEPNIVSRPGARIIEALELFARGIHPDQF